MSHGLDGSIATLTLLEAPVHAIVEGDGFIARAGCDKRIATCSAKFADVANFRGFPNISGQDAVLRYTSQDGGHEGSVL
ncbi:MAG: phage BR0599 family protein [Gemmobacter sp.]|nr:phage BR0599 family protein [Gemmobacter sp.]